MGTGADRPSVSAARIGAALVAAAALAGSAAAGPSSPAAPGRPGASPPPGARHDTVAASVEMTNQLTFAPDSVVIRAGQSVRFENASALVHTVTGDPSEASLEASVRLPEGAEPFHSGRLAPGGSFVHAFETPGRYRYFCVPHEGAEMRGTVVVRPAGSGPDRSPSR